MNSPYRDRGAVSASVVPDAETQIVAENSGKTVWVRVGALVVHVPTAQVASDLIEAFADARARLEAPQAAA